MAWATTDTAAAIAAHAAHGDCPRIRGKNFSTLSRRSLPAAAYNPTHAETRAAPIAIQEAVKTLRNAAGNFYINDKPTGAVVGQQPFGGSRASGTNDKAGSLLNLSRWVSPRAIKETFLPPKDYRYPFLEEE